MLKTTLLALVVVLTGCASIKSMQELEAEALRTGDWSAVHQREQILARQAARRTPVCPAGTMSYCEKVAAERVCACLSRDDVARALVMR